MYLKLFAFRGLGICVVGFELGDACHGICDQRIRDRWNCVLGIRVVGLVLGDMCQGIRVRAIHAAAWVVRNRSCELRTT